MSVKLIGALCILIGAGGWGVLSASRFKAKLRMMNQLYAALGFMICELQFRRTPLPQLFRKAADEYSGRIGHVLKMISQELDAQISPNAQRCVLVALDNCLDIPENIVELLRSMGTSLGKFDVDGQLQGLEAVRTSCYEQLKQLAQNKDIRIREYQTVGLCAGAAMAILFV